MFRPQHRAVRRAAAAVALLLVAGLQSRLPVRAQIAQPDAGAKGGSAIANFDIRISAGLRAQLLQRLGRTTEDAQAKQRVSREALAALRADRPAADAAVSPFTGGAELVRNPRGTLTDAAPGADSAAIVRDFISTNAALYGLARADVGTLQFGGESVSRASGLRMLRAHQTIGGIPVFQSDARFLLDRDGRLVRTVGRLVPQAAAAGAGTVPALSASDALGSAMRSLGGTAAAGDVSSRLVYFPLAPGVLVLAYEQVFFTDGPGDYLTVVDATAGTLLWRKNIRNNQAAPTQQARFSIYVQGDGVTPADSPAPLSPTTAAPGSGTQAPAISRTIVELLAAQDLTASPAGWMPDGGTSTTGNNVDACVDRVQGAGEINVCDAGTLDNNGRPVGNPDTFGRDRDFLGSTTRNFDYTPAPAGGNPDAGDTPTGIGAAQDAFRRGAATQVFYVTNWYHDRVFHLGFDEAAGNFQTVNFSGFGTGGDAVRADVQDGSGTNNANFSTPPDGTPGRMQMYRFTGPTIDRDGALDADVVIHELTHGLSNRLVGNGAGLTWNVGAGMGEGWSDFYALSLLNGTQADDPDATYASAAYATYRLGGSYTDNYVYGIRRFPYSTDNTVNPLTWADVDDVTANYSGGVPISPLGFERGGAFEVHNIGEIWALTLWEIRSRVIADPAGANGSVPIGNQTMLQLVTDALKLTPNEPSFIDAREALLDADCATNACANERWIWEGFADRGLGHDAAAPLSVAGFGGGHMGLHPSSLLPQLDVSGVGIDDSLGNGNGAIDPGEPVRLTLQLRNPWRGTSFGVPGATVILTSPTPGLTILDGSSTYPAIPAGGTASGDTFLVTAGPGLACGQSIALTFEITSALGAATTSVTRRVGLASGTGSPIAYTRTHTAGLPIPDDRPTGVTSTLAISDDLEIADLDFRVDSITHTFPGDLTVLLRAPNGYGTDLILMTGGAVAGGGDGDNFVNVVIDDDATGDLLAAPNSAAPYTGRWRPVFNSPTWSVTGRSPDPVGQLSRLDGSSTQGDWTVLVADAFPLDTGTLDGWSLIVTPRAFTCSTFTAPPPATTITLTPPAPNGSAGWYVSPVNLAVSASSSGLSVVDTRCALDPAVPPATFGDLPPGCPYSGTGAAVSTQGTHTLYAASLDEAGNSGTPVSATFRIDSSPPTTAVTLGPAAPNGQAGWYVSPVTVAVAAADPSGTVAEIRCVLDPATPPASFANLPAGCAFSGAGAAVSAQGTHTVYAASVDEAGNASVPVSAAFRIDSAPPTTTVTLGPAAPNGQAGWYVSPVTVAVAGADGGGTVAETRCVLDPAAPPVSFASLPAGCAFGGPGASVGAEGAHTVYAASLDAAGNAATVVSTPFRIDATPPALTCDAPAPRFALNQAGASVSATVTDATSGAASATASAAADTTTPGTRSATITGTDLAGNAGSIACTYTVAAPAPTVTIATPTVDPTLAASAFFIPLGGTAASAADITAVTWTNDRGGSGTATGTTSWMIPAVALQAGVNVLTVSATDANGGVGTDTLTVNFDTVRYHLAEGSTGSFFTMDLALANPNPVPARLSLGFAKQDGTEVTQELTLAATSRATVAVRDVPGLDATPVSLMLTSRDQLPIVVERTMSWDATGYGGSGESAVGQPRRTWMFAEGSQGFFRTYLLLLNPDTEATTATVTFLLDAGASVQRTYPLLPHGRMIVDAGGVPEVVDHSFGILVDAERPILAERAMYFSDGVRPFAGGHASSGSPDPSTTWFFAEGATGAFFDTYILLGNPGDAPANVTLRFMLDSGATVTQQRTVPPRARLTVDVEHADPLLASAAMATQVTSDVPIVAERSMYWIGGPGPWAEGHNSAGIPATGTKWALAEGRAGGERGWQTYILLVNPSTVAANVSVTYLKTDGTTIVEQYVVPPATRRNVYANSVPGLADASFGALVEVTNSVGIVVERSLYWNANGTIWAAGTNVGATRVP